MKSFLMAGQSNMAGRGPVNTVEPIVNPHCFMFRNGLWVVMSEPVNPDKRVTTDPADPTRAVSGVTLATSFADAYQKHFNEDVGLIPCAYGGTTASQWQKGEVLYDYAVFCAKLAMRSSTFAGIIWHQGENDSENEERVANYHDRLTNIILNFRKDLGNVPVILGELGEISLYKNGKFRFGKEINAIIHQVASEQSCPVASSEGLTNCPDNVHFSSPSSRIFGLRYFDKYLEATAGKEG